MQARRALTRNERYCENGLWDYADETGERALYHPLARELKLQQLLCEHARDGGQGAS